MLFRRKNDKKEPFCKAGRQQSKNGYIKTAKQDRLKQSLFQNIVFTILI